MVAITLSNICPLGALTLEMDSMPWPCLTLIKNINTGQMWRY
jgi:hypothetical protein